MVIFLKQFHLNVFLRLRRISDKGYKIDLYISSPFHVGARSEEPKTVHIIGDVRSVEWFIDFGKNGSALGNGSAYDCRYGFIHSRALEMVKLDHLLHSHFWA